MANLNQTLNIISKPMTQEDFNNHAKNWGIANAIWMAKTLGVAVQTVAQWVKDQQK